MEIFLARQPIFDIYKRVIGYELLYRSDRAFNFFNQINGDIATSTVISNSINMNLSTLSNNKKVFINFTEKLLNDEVATLLPKELLVIEILENIVPNEHLISKCRKLKENGYTLALDDFIYNKKYLPLIEISNILKVDFLKTSIQDKISLVRKFSSYDRKLLAEKIETNQDFEMAKKMGYTLFQGYFFCKPEIIASKKISPVKLNYIRLIRSVYQCEPNFNCVANIIKKDMSLTYELLRLINCLKFYRGNKITSINHAVSLLGLEEIKKWVSLLSLRIIGEDKPLETVRYSFIRAKFCELMAPNFGFINRESELFLTGLFSLIDVLMDRQIEEIINELPISDDIKDTLLQNNGPFKDIISLISSCEKAQWDNIEFIAKSNNLILKDIYQIYMKSIKWVEDYLL
ncbi:MAG: EAL and HDOD domain-containing protein [Eubacteriaceae bacterium]